MEFLQYDIRVAVLIAVFYMFYRLLLSHESLHRLNRAVLLGTAIASFILPLCVITVHRTELLPPMASMSGVPVTADAAPSEQTPWWRIALPIVFWTGAVLTFALTIVSIIKVCMLISRCEKHRQDDGTVIAVSDDSVSPFSWMHFIVLPRSEYEHPDEAILTHERAHIRLHHSLDVLLVDILTSLQWFNPAMWMLRSDLRSVHEFEADAAVLKSGIDARQYQYLLVRKAMAPGGYSVANGINHSTLKQRITMMQNKNNNRHAWVRALYIVPVIALSLYASARTVVDYQISPAKGQTEATASGTAGTAQSLASATNGATDEVLPANEVKEIIASKDSANKELKDALIIIDDKVATESDLNALNPNDIKAINIVKDAKVLSKYNAKGKKTAIQVITKRNDNAASTSTHTEVLPVAEEMPKFPGNVNQYIAMNMKYPEVAIKNGAQGRAIVRFVVNTDGHVSDAQIVNSVARVNKQPSGKDNEDAEALAKAKEKATNESNAAFQAEALRVVNSMPSWTPGKDKGKPVAVWYTVPMTFKMQ